ncbi:6-bladed beta-propeller, partial [Candidatus Saccharibacteria bacterium]|nr:6-bladed beta-propeller [Candidatus Saccharibacteria bacterium]
VVVIAPATSVRAFGDGNGSEGNPYIITTCEELQDMADDLDAYVDGVLISDSFSTSAINGTVSTSGAFIAVHANVTESAAIENAYYDRYAAGIDYCYTQSRYGSGNGEFDDPSGIATDSSGNLFVADRTNNRIQKFNSSGDYVTQWGASGTGNGEFDGIYDVVVDGVGNVYAVDSYNNRIQKFNSDGAYIAQWGTEGSGNGELFDPTHIAVDGSDNIYVADTGNNRIQKFNSTGTYITKWGASGSGNGQFTNPYGIALDTADNVYVVDSGNSRIQKFNSTGTYITKWGTYGSDAGEFNTPIGLAVDSADNIYVTDAGNHKVQKFTASGSYLAAFGVYGADDGEFEAIRDISIDPSDNIYVSDASKHSVQKFTQAGEFILEIGRQPTSDSGCVGVNTGNSQPDYFFDPAHEPFAGSWSQDVWSFSGSALPTLAAQDSDNDGITNAVENIAPNNGDGNGDGVLDATQPHVTSFVNTETDRYVTIETPDGTTITTVTSEAAPDESGMTHLFGLVGFTVTGLTTGDTIPIEIFYPNPDEVDASTISPRKYYPSTTRYEELEEATVTGLDIDSQPTLRLSYSLTDGGAYDLDQTADGQITDPVSLATTNRTTDALADTGENVLPLVVTACMMVFIATMVLKRRQIFV